MPGDVKLISSGELLKKATNAKSIFVAFNTGPWTAMKKWAKSDPSAGELAVLIDSGEMHRGLEYRSSIEGEKIGSLLSLWPRAAENPLLRTLASIISQAWNVNYEKLFEEEGWTHENNTLHGTWNRE